MGREDISYIYLIAGGVSPQALDCRDVISDALDPDFACQRRSALNRRTRAALCSGCYSAATYSRVSGNGALARTTSWRRLVCIGGAELAQPDQPAWWTLREVCGDAERGILFHCSHGADQGGVGTYYARMGLDCHVSRSTDGGGVCVATFSWPHGAGYGDAASLTCLGMRTTAGHDTALYVGRVSRIVRAINACRIIRLPTQLRNTQ